MKVRGKAKIRSIQRKNGEADLTLNKAVDIAEEMSLMIRKILKFRGINKDQNLSFRSALDFIVIFLGHFCPRGKGARG